MTLPKKPNVCAVIVTYNRLELLKRCLDGVRSQTCRPDHVVVVNNGSTDGTGAWLRTQSDLEVINRENLGAGAGFVAGIVEARRQDYRWLWCMDDDVSPVADALEVQLAAARGDRVVIAHKMRGGMRLPLANHLCEKTGRKVDRPSPEGETEEVNFGHFEGMLIPSSLVDRIGLPDQRTFVWGEDILFGYLASRVTKVILPKRPLFEKLVPEPRNHVSNVTLYFDTRNHFLIFESLRRAGTLSPMAYVYVGARMLKHAVWILADGKNIVLRLRLLGFGLFDAIRGRWGAGSFFEITAPK